MRKRTEIAMWGVVVVASLGLHAAAFGGLGERADGFGRKPQPCRPTLVEMSVAKLNDVAPPDAEHSAPRVALAHPARRAAPKASVPTPPSAASPPAAETVADFTGVTMTNDGSGAGWSSATGNGQAMRGAVGRPGARAAGRDVDGDLASQSHPPGPPIVGVGDLSRPPSAPDLANRLARAYPDDARKNGIAGKAVIRARIMPDGHVREMSMLSESAGGFGAACELTLRDSIWTAPLDQQAHAVSTFITYTCRFEVQ